MAGSRGGLPPVAKMTSVSIHEILTRHRSRDPSAPAIITTRAVVSYAELLDRIADLAGWLVANGFSPEAPTAILVRDDVDHLITAMSLLCLASPQVNLPPQETDSSRRAVAERVGATQLVGDRDEAWMSGMKRFFPPFQRLPRAGAGAEPNCLLPVDAKPLYQNTSGSTNIPKTIPIPLQRMLTVAERLASDPYERRVLRGSSMQFDSSRFHRIVSLLAGNTCVFAEIADGESLRALCAGAKVSAIHIGAYKLASLVSSVNAKRPILPTFTQIITGGSRVPGALRERVRQTLTPNLWVLYATSEIGEISRADPNQHEAFPEGVGFPSVNVTVEIVDPSGAILPPGSLGHARVRKKGAPSSYVGDKVASKSFRDDAFYPGDILSQKEGEPLVFHGRADDLMILNGINILPAAIEDRLQEHPAVREAVAFPVSSRVHGEIPVAAIVLSSAHHDLNTESIVAFCRETLGVRGPRGVFVVDGIPRNPAGKPLRRQLAEAYGSSRPRPSAPDFKAMQR